MKYFVFALSLFSLGNAYAGENSLIYYPPNRLESLEAASAAFKSAAEKEGCKVSNITCLVQSGNYRLPTRGQAVRALYQCLGKSSNCVNSSIPHNVSGSVEGTCPVNYAHPLGHYDSRFCVWSPGTKPSRAPKVKQLLIVVIADSYPNAKAKAGAQLRAAGCRFESVSCTMDIGRTARYVCHTSDKGCGSVIPQCSSPTSSICSREVSDLHPASGRGVSVESAEDSRGGSPAN